MCCIRQARPEDAAVLAGIYAPYVRDTAITFEYDPPDAAEFARRIRKTQEQFPYLVCEVDGKPQAYAYASHFHERAAFQWDAELSVYVAACAQQRGIGRALYACLIAFLQEQGYSTLYALITVPNDNSERLHAKLGFERAALYPRTGYKFGQWRDMIVMEKRLSPPLLPQSRRMRFPPFRPHLWKTCCGKKPQNATQKQRPGTRSGKSGLAL